MSNEPQQPMDPCEHASSDKSSKAAPDLRIQIGHGAWLTWRDFCLRSAGFPFSQFATTADRECAVLADRFAEDSSAESDFRAHWDTALERILEAMFEIVDTGGIRQALIWQNPGFLARGVDWLQHDASEGGALPVRNRHRKRRELTLVKYLQRYHAKNETIGFFGPSAWGKFSETAEKIQLKPGPALIRDRITVFEDWAVESLARVFAEEFGLRPYLPPALPMDVRLHGRAVLRAGVPTVVLDPDLALVASCCDGVRTPRAIAAELSWRGGGTRRPTAESIIRDLEELAEQGVIVWGFDIPPSPLAAEALRTQLARLPATPARDSAIDVLGELEKLCIEIPEMAENAHDLHKALNDLDEKFQEITRTSAYRESSSAAKGRRVVVEDCQRDIDVTIGTDFLQDIGPAMGVMLDSARWLLWQLGIFYTTVLGGIVAQLGGRADRDVPLVQVISGIVPALERQHGEEQVIADFQERWRKILRYEHACARRDYTAEQLQGPVSQLFDAPPPPWHSAGYHSPDVMVAETLDADCYFAVMGEMHISQASFNSLSFTQFHPNCKDLIAAADEYVHPHPCFVPLYPRSLPDISARFYPTPELQSERYSYLSFGRRCGARSAPQDRIKPIDGLVVRTSPAGLRVVGSGDDHPGTPLLEVVGEFLTLRATDAFRLMPALPHTPRITVDRLVVARETWRPCLTDVPVGKGEDEAAAFAMIRQWARRLGIPRHVFWRVPWEPKPIYLDFESPLLVGLFAMTLRRTPQEPDQQFTISEMLPRPDQLWLRDADDRRYTSELRMVFVDGLRESAVNE